MRIISGKFKGRKFIPPAKKWPTRPTTDIAKEGLFNILTNRLNFETISMCDLFGGTGNHCLEFISRGCMDTTYVDRYFPAVQYVRKISSEWGIEEQIHIMKMDVFQFIPSSSKTFNYIFAGPPYGLKKIPHIPDLIFDHKRLKEGGLFVLEHNPDHNFEAHPRFEQRRNYGQTIFSFFN